ncbi:MAG TPA: D-alanyl-D-alanine carboxypeptidase [Clostridiaceae bacterium]|nr:D-alanyl-D-alanine carboxypeptidase [Clostridiaceae bacterium]
MCKKILRSLSCCILSVLLLFLFPSAALTNNISYSSLPDSSLAGPEIKAKSAVLMESKRGQILYGKSPDTKLHISAANKIMCALVVIESTKLDAKVTISKEAVDTQGSTLNLEVGEKYSVEDLLYAIMLTSANDVAIALAEYVGGDIAKFVDMMNTKAYDLNLKDTYFTNPTGLYDENQYTTAYDMAMLIKYAISNPTFNRIFATSLKPWVSAGGKSTVLKSQNELFWSYDGVDGGKTGYNVPELQTAITTASNNNLRLICVVLDSPQSSVFVDSTNLLNFGFLHFRTGILVKKGEPLQSVTIGDQIVNLISSTDIYYTHPIGESFVKSFDVKIINDLTPPIQKNMIIGTARYILQDNTIIDINLYPDREISPPQSLYSVISSKVSENRDIFILVGTLLAIEVVLMIYNLTRYIAKKRNKKRNPESVNN